MARGQIDPIFLVALGLGGYYLWSRSTTIPSIAVQPSTLRPVATPRMEPPSTGSYNKWLQTSLNRLMGCNLKVDGIIGPLTQACTKRFQEMWGLAPDGIVGAETDYYIKSALGMPGYIEQPYGIPSGDVWY